LSDASERSSDRSQRSSEDDNSAARVADSLSLADSSIKLERASRSEASRRSESALESSAELTSRFKRSSSLSQVALGAAEALPDAPGSGPVEDEDEACAQDKAGQNEAQSAKQASHLIAPPRRIR
jgi:hypothetical protein